MSIERARDDLADLERAANQLRAKLTETEDRAAKVRIYIEMAAVYDPQKEVVAPQAAPMTPTNGAHPPRNKGGRPRAGGGIVERAQNGASAFLNAERRAIPTRELLEKLESQGILIGGSQPRSNLSGMLSRSPVFKSGKEGWTLSEWTNSPILSGSESAEADGESLLSGGPGLFGEDAA
jgi:hypothetical protein